MSVCVFNLFLWLGCAVLWCELCGPQYCVAVSKVWTPLHVAQIGWKDRQTEGGMVTREGREGGRRRRVGLIGYENDPSSSTWIQTLPMWLSSSLVRDVALLVHPLNLGGACDLLWLMELGGSEHYWLPEKAEHLLECSLLWRHVLLPSE